MKKIIVLLILVSFQLYGQTTYEQLNEMYKQSKFFDASKEIPAFSQANIKDFKSQILCGDIYYELEEYKKALDYYLIAEKIDKREYDIQYRLGRTYHRLGDAGKAFEYLDDAIDEVKKKKNIEAHIELAKANIRDKNITEAEIWINRAKDKNKKEPIVFITLGDLYFSQGVYELAKNNYLEALQLDDKNVLARQNLAESYYWMANREANTELANELFKKAVMEYDLVAELDPFNAKAFFQTGKVLFWASRFEDAAPKLNRAVTLNPENKLARWLLAQSLTNLNRCDSAAQHLEWVSNNIDTVKIKAQLFLARCYFSNGESEKAVMQFEKIKQDTTLDVIDMKRFGNAAFLSGDTVKAVSIFEETITMSPASSCDLMLLLGQLYYVKKDYNNAINKFVQRIETPECEEGKEKAIYFAGLSSLFYANEEGIAPEEKTLRLDKAAKYFSQAIALDSTDLRSMVFMGDVYAAKSDLEAAGAQYEKVIKKGLLEPEKYSQQLRQSFAKICGMYLENKKFDGAIKYGMLWAENQPDVEYGPLYAAIAYQNKYVNTQSDADKKGACEWYQKVLDVNPKNTTAKKNRDALGC